jgi:hypothetical protein
LIVNITQEDDLYKNYVRNVSIIFYPYAFKDLYKFYLLYFTDINNGTTTD